METLIPAAEALLLRRNEKTFVVNGSPSKGLDIDARKAYQSHDNTRIEKSNQKHLGKGFSNSS